MKKSIYLISESSRALDSIFYNVIKNQNHMVKGTFDYFEASNFLKFNINKNVENPTTICAYPVLPNKITPTVFNKINSPLQQIQLPNNTLTSVDYPQMIIGTFAKPYLTIEQERNAIFIEVPTYLGERYFALYAKLIRCHANINGLPYLENTKPANAKLLRKYYFQKIKAITALVNAFSPRELEVVSPVTVNA